MVPQWASGTRGSSSALGGRKPAAGCGCPLPSSEERRLHNFVRERLASAAPPPPPHPPSAAAGLPLCWRAAQEAEREGARERAGAPCRPPGETDSRPGTPGLALPRRRRPSGTAPRAGTAPGAPAPARLTAPGPAAAGPATLFRRAAPSRLWFGPGRAQAATAGWARGTWRPGSPDRAPRQSAPAPRALPARSR